MGIFGYTAENRVVTLVPVSINVNSYRKLDLDVICWIRVSKLSLFWNIVTFRNVEIMDNIDKVLSAAKYRNLSFKEIDMIRTKVDQAKIGMKLKYIDFWYTKD